MKQLFRIVLVFCCLVLLWNPLGSCNEGTQLILSLDLRPIGYLYPVAERDFRAYTFLRDSVAFLDDGTLAVSFYRKNERPGLFPRDGTPGSAVVFHSVLLDPLTGSVMGQRTWGNAGNWNALLPLENGCFLIQDEVWVKVYSRELREIASKKLEMPGDILPRFSVSPSGHSLYEFQDWLDTKRGWLTRIDLLDPATLLTKQSKITPGHQFETVSDTRVAYFPTAIKGALRLFVYAIDDSSPAKSPELFDQNTGTAKDLTKSGCESASFVNNDVIAVTGNCPSLMLIRSGEEFAEVYLPEYWIGGEIRPSSGGQRFAFSRMKRKMRHSHITYLDLCVYDFAQHKVVFTTAVSPLPQHKFAFAISPDGSLLAMQSDGLLRVWRVAYSH
ncbi:MAG TPA: hypothetical protein VJO16_14560 [Candidatus Acidoferrum sp.]|nr:hypothetical protein [Candidatus Acidoferrum sp.]